MSASFHQRLTALDAVFLHAETAEVPLHIGGVAILEGAPFFDDRGEFRLAEVRQQVESRLHLLPKFRCRIMSVPYGQGRPVWVDDPDFDIERHVRLSVLPPPGDRLQLGALCDDLQMRVLDRDRPLWEIWMVGGLADGNVAMIEKLHHALVDGVSGVDVATAMFDVERDIERDRPARWEPRPAPSPGQLLLDSLWQRATEPAELALGLRAAARLPGHALPHVGGLLGAATTFLGLHPLAPHTSLNRAVGSHRRIYTVRQSMPAIKEVTTALGGTANDVVLAAVTGGLRSLLLHRGEPTDVALTALVPVSVRVDDEHLALGNRVAACFPHLPVAEVHPLRRFERVSATMHDLKARHQADVSELLLDTADLLPPALPALLSRWVVHHQPLVNLVITNLPGPPFPLYFMGAEILELLPIVPLGANLPLGVAILSYNGQLVLGIHVDPEAVPDADAFVAGVEASFAELSALAGVSSR